MYNAHPQHGTFVAHSILTFELPSVTMYLFFIFNIHVGPAEETNRIGLKRCSSLPAPFLGIEHLRLPNAGTCFGYRSSSLLET